MAIVCAGCGAYVQPHVDALSETVRCPDCGHKAPMRILPLFIVTGASGVGKTAVVGELRGILPQWEVFETDIICGADWQQTRSNWLRIAHSIAQGGRGTILCGTMMPADIDKCDHRPLFRQVHYLNLHCEDAIRDARLRARPAWRGATEAFLEEHRRFARWLLDHAATDFDPPMSNVDTGALSPGAVARQIAAWALARWPEGPRPARN